jgi:phosphate transport system substrate-binding protein
MMRLIAGHWVKSSSNAHHDKLTEIPPLNQAPYPLSVTVPKDYSHGAVTWDSHDATHTPPNGSSAGIAALSADKKGLIAFARSSRGPNAGETSTLDFWAYALGAVDFVTFPGTHAPAGGLTQAQLISIYTCDPNTGAPFASNWSQVGGTNAPIIKYAPQAGSGTLSFFGSKMLNGAAVDANCDNAHKSISLEEHDARGVSDANKPNAIYMYDWARYNAQHKTHFEQDLTNGAVLGAFGVTTPVVPTSHNVNESNTRFFGTRYVYNVEKHGNHPKTAGNQYQDILSFIGVRPTKQGGAGYICSGKAKADIIKAGFVPLVKFGTGSLALPKSYCRADPKPL